MRKLVVPAVTLALAVGCGTGNRGGDGSVGGINGSTGGIDWVDGGSGGSGGNSGGNGGFGDGGGSTLSVDSLRREVEEFFDYQEGVPIDNNIRNILVNGYGCAYYLSKTYGGELGRDLVEVVCGGLCGDIAQDNYWYWEDEEICRNIAGENHSICQRGDFCDTIESRNNYCAENPARDRPAEDFFSEEVYRELDSFSNAVTGQSSLDEDYNCDGPTALYSGSFCAAYFGSVPFDVQERACDDFCEFQEYNSNWTKSAVILCKSAVRAVSDVCYDGDCSHYSP